MESICTDPILFAQLQRRWGETVEKHRVTNCEFDLLLTNVLHGLNSLPGVQTVYSCSSHTPEEKASVVSEQGPLTLTTLNDDLYLLIAYRPEGLQHVHAIFSRVTARWSSVLRPTLQMCRMRTPAGMYRRGDVPVYNALSFRYRFKRPEYHVKERAKLLSLLEDEIRAENRSYTRVDQTQAARC